VALPQVKQVHFIGIGGYGMSALAQVLLQMGYRVTGSDINDSALVRRLAEQGADIKLFHHPGNIGRSDLVVFSTAIPPDNSELQEALRRGITVWHRSELLAALINSHYGIAVTGTHGKTTTSTMIALLLEAGGLDPTALIGGVVSSFQSNARFGRSEYLVAEACESDHSFLRYRPHIAVITNVEADHLEHYQGDFNLLQEAYRAFLQNLVADGCAVLCFDDPFLRDLAPRVARKAVTYGLDESGADYSGRDIDLTGRGGSFTFYRHNEPLPAPVTLQVPGRHNVSNAVAALAVAAELGLDLERCAGALKGFRGAKRRFEIIGEVKGATIIDDYAHHPTEVKVTLQAARAAANRVCCIFQPHRYSRTDYFFEEFAHSFTDADLVLLHKIYPAGEKPREGITSAALARRISEVKGREVYYSDDMDELGRLALDWAQPGDMIIVMGAGDITGLAYKLAQT
jgi:UDP-N-acetylmuramate--alanine ligase